MANRWKFIETMASVAAGENGTKKPFTVIRVRRITRLSPAGTRAKSTLN
jgi:hypothetical protein